MVSLSPEFYSQTRKKLTRGMLPDSMLILAGNGEIERTKDVPYPFRQSNNFLYLTGISQPDAFLVIHKAEDGTITEQLCIRRLHPFMAAWEGRSNRIDELRNTSKLEDVAEYHQIEELITDLLKHMPQIVYLDMPDEITAQLAAWQLWQQIKIVAPDLELSAINPDIDALRVVKSPEEIECIKQAIAETERALQQVRPLLIPGVTELEIAAEFIRYSSVAGFEQCWPPIVSFGKNSCVIHHTPDHTKLEAGNLVLFDVGLEVSGYAADISRMVQIGEMSKRQRQVLQAVKNIQSEAIKLMKPGITIDDFEHQAAEIVVQALIELGLFTSVEAANQLEGELQWPAYRRYFNHYISHFLGLDAHDVGSRQAEFVPGMLLTCEPGIYIAEEGIGVRIEDDILITTGGNTNLSQAVVLDS